MAIVASQGIGKNNKTLTEGHCVFVIAGKKTATGAPCEAVVFR